MSSYASLCRLVSTRGASPWSRRRTAPRMGPRSRCSSCIATMFGPRGRYRRSSPGTAGSTSPARRRTFRVRRRGWKPAASSLFRICAAAGSTASAGTARACSRTSRTSSMIFTPPRRRWYPGGGRGPRRRAWDREATRQAGRRPRRSVRVHRLANVPWNGRTGYARPRVNILRFLREQAKDYKCSVCGANHAGSDIRVLGKLESAWIVRVTCAKCDTAFKLLVVVDEQRAAISPVKEEPERPKRPAVSADEVIDAHEFLEAYSGDVRTLFTRGDKVKTEPDRS